MGFFNEWRRLAKPYADDEDDFEYDEYDDEPVGEEPEYDEEPREARPTRRAAAPAQSSTPAAADGHRPRVRAMSTSSSPRAQIVVLRPEEYEKLSDMADHLLDNRAVVVNLSKIDESTATRIVDFLSGCAYALDGHIKKVATRTYLIAPFNMEIMGDLVEELENAGSYL